MAEEKKPKKKIEIDEDFFKMMTGAMQEFKDAAKDIKGMKESIEELKKNPVPPTAPPAPQSQAVGQESDSFLQSSEFAVFKKQKNPQESTDWQNKAINEFRPKLDKLMREYQISSVVASRLVKI